MKPEFDADPDLIESIRTALWIADRQGDTLIAALLCDALQKALADKRKAGG